MVNILELIRELRESKGYSQSEFAKQIKMSQRSYSRIERGETKLDFEILQNLSKALNMRLIDLITYPDKYIKSDESVRYVNEGVPDYNRKRKVLIEIEMDEDEFQALINNKLSLKTKLYGH